MTDVYGIVGSNIQYVGTCPSGGILMSEARPDDGYIAAEDGTWEIDTDFFEEAIKTKRDVLLAACDWRYLSGNETYQSDDWATYRQELRDITDQDDYPFDVTWPTSPDDEDEEATS